MFSEKEQNQLNKMLEPTREVHGTWKADDEAESWSMPQHSRYLGGSQGGGQYGPSTTITTIINQGYSVEDIWMNVLLQ
jgi:hypothetical protein